MNISRIIYIMLIVAFILNKILLFMSLILILNTKEEKEQANKNLEYNKTASILESKQFYSNMNYMQNKDSLLQKEINEIEINYQRSLSNNEAKFDDLVKETALIYLFSTITLLISSIIFKRQQDGRIFN